MKFVTCNAGSKVPWAWAFDVDRVAFAFTIQRVFATKLGFCLGGPTLCPEANGDIEIVLAFGGNETIVDDKFLSVEKELNPIRICSGFG